MSEKDFFIGWAAKAPKADRRFFLRAGVGLLAGTGGLAAALAALQARPGTGNWYQDDVREWRGIVTAEPYAMMRTKDLGGTPRTALLVSEGKCGVADLIGSFAGKPVVIRGSLIQRGKNAMIAVVEASDWIKLDDKPADAALAFPNVETLGNVSLRGEILDSKCWFGAMRPSEGKVHKACAALCIRGGIPPAFFARDRNNKSALMIMTRNGGPHAKNLLPYVADPVEVKAVAKRWGDLLLLDGPVSAIKRI